MDVYNNIDFEHFGHGWVVELTTMLTLNILVRGQVWKHYDKVEFENFNQDGNGTL